MIGYDKLKDVMFDFIGLLAILPVAGLLLLVDLTIFGLGFLCSCIYGKRKYGVVYRPNGLTYLPKEEFTKIFY